MGATSDEFPPLWPQGFHPATLRELQILCVEDFPLSSTRAELLNAFYVVFECLREADVDGVIWLDGSFVTEKINPTDMDFILVVKSEFVDKANERQEALMDSLYHGNLWESSFRCDTSVLPIFPETGASDGAIAFWRLRFGFSKEHQTPKGIVVVRLKEEEEPA